MRLDSLIIVNLILKGIPSHGVQTAMVLEFLKAFFKNDGSLVYEEVVFDIDSDDKMDAHAKKMEKLAEKLSRCVYVDEK